MKSLVHSENKWTTSMGAWFAGERVVFRGKDLHHDLRDMSWMELYLYGITGREFTENQLKVLNAMWTFTSYPDPRIWNNRVAALAGTARSTAPLAMASAMAVSEARIYGHGPNVRSLDFYLRAKNEIDKGADLLQIIKTELRERRTIYGFGRPVARSDERVPHFLKLLEELHMDKGMYVSLALQVEQILLNGRWRMRLNIGGLDAAIAAEFGFTVEEYHLFMIPSFLAGMTPCFLDAKEKDEGTFFPFRCECLHYEGVPRRKWNTENHQAI